ncbi:MAG TPA: hypothetical protein VFL59_02005 [Candidatus Nanopelagicales bacterium]|nr:hypothetical protein [Candidatus Nanopelagicales bacterium]
MTAVQVALTGDRAEGRMLLENCWDATPSGEHAKRVVIAHYLADLQDELDDEIRWDESALTDYPRVGETDLAAIGIASASGLAPSLHLNLGDGYLRRGDLQAARQQLDAGIAAAGALGDDGYGDLVRKGLDGLAQRLAERTA